MTLRSSFEKSARAANPPPLASRHKLSDRRFGSELKRSSTLALPAGPDGDAKSGVTANEAKAFADEAVAALADAVKLGWALPSALKEPDFDALLVRADFQKLRGGGGEGGEGGGDRPSAAGEELT